LLPVYILHCRAAHNTTTQRSTQVITSLLMNFLCGIMLIAKTQETLSILTLEAYY